MTLGDYWGVKNVHPEAFDDKGTSAIIVNTDKGHDALSEIADELKMGATTYEGVLAGNPLLEKPCLYIPSAWNSWQTLHRECLLTSWNQSGRSS